MPVYQLKPIDTSDPNWIGSTHIVACWVNANDEDEARDLATRKFKIGTGRKSDLTVRESPWNDPQLVACAENPNAPVDLDAKEVRTVPVQDHGTK